MREDEAKAQAAQQMGGLRLGPKPFGECSEAEQIARLVEEVKGWRNLFTRMQSQLSALEAHAHGPNGQLMIPLHNAQVMGGMVGAASAWDTLR